jgi:hypothetical protein
MYSQGSLSVDLFTIFKHFKNSIMKVKITAFIAICLLFLDKESVLGQDMSDLRKETSDFVNNSRQVYRYDEGARSAIWEAYCGSLDPASPQDINLATQIGQNYQQREIYTVHELLDKSHKIIEGLEKFRAAASTKDEAEKLFLETQREVDNLHRLEEGVVLKGSNSPFVQYAIEYGKDMHKKMAGDYGSPPKIADKEFSGIRPDLVFIDGSGCWIYEFKPKNSAAENKGRDQLKGYKEVVEKYFEEKFPNGRKGDFLSNDSDHGGADFLKKLQECEKCWTSDGSQIIINTDVISYSPCELKY